MHGGLEGLRGSVCAIHAQAYARRSSLMTQRPTSSHILQSARSPAPTVTLPSGSTFDTQNGSSLLEAATRAQVLLAHSCANGRCGTCRRKVLSGHTLARQPELGLSEQEQQEGWILSCVREAVADLHLQAEDLSNLVLPPPRTWPCRIQEITHPAAEIARVVLRLPPAARLEFTAGQYIDVTGPNGARRSYSLASAERADGHLELHIRAVEDGGALSRYWFAQARANELLRLNGPLGTFVLRPASGLDLVFLATGTGIAPIKAMLESMGSWPQAQLPALVTVLWGARHRADLYLDGLTLPGCTAFVPVLSRRAVINLASRAVRTCCRCAGQCRRNPPERCNKERSWRMRQK